GCARGRPGTLWVGSGGRRRRRDGRRRGPRCRRRAPAAPSRRRARSSPAARPLPASADSGRRRRPRQPHGYASAVAAMLALVGGDELNPGNEPQDEALAVGARPGPAYVIATAAARGRPDLAVKHATRWFAGLGLEV